MKIFILASTIIMALPTLANARDVGGEMGGAGGMRLHGSTSDTAEHHQFRGSALHEVAADAHTRAAAHHKKAAAMYRKKNDSNAIRHAEQAIYAANDAFAHTEDTKAILPELSVEEVEKGTKAGKRGH